MDIYNDEKIRKLEKEKEIYYDICKKLINKIKDNKIREKLNDIFYKYRFGNQKERTKNSLREQFKNVLIKAQNKDITLSFNFEEFFGEVQKHYGYSEASCEVTSKIKKIFKDKYDYRYLRINDFDVEILQKIFEDYENTCLQLTRAIEEIKNYEENQKNKAEERKRVEQEKRLEQFKKAEEEKEKEYWIQRGGNPKLKSEVSQNIDDYLKNDIHNSKFYSHSYYVRKNKRQIEEAYPQLNYSGYYSFDTMQRGIDINREIDCIEQNKEIYHNGKSDLFLIDQLAVDIFNSIIEFKLNDSIREKDLDDLFEKFSFDKGLEKYESAYNKFMKKYRKYNQEEKAEMARDDERIKYIAREIGLIPETIGKINPITPQQLKGCVNDRLAKYIVNHHSFVGFDNQSSKLEKLTEYMSIDEMIKLYKKVIYDKYDGILAYYDSYYEKVSNIQRVFANLLLERNDLYRNKSGEEREVGLVRVTKKYLKENVKFSLRYPESRKVNEETEIDVSYNAASVTDAKAIARKRAYGMSKLEKTIARINGEWKRFEELMNIDELTDDYIEEEEIRSLLS